MTVSERKCGSCGRPNHYAGDRSHNCRYGSADELEMAEAKLIVSVPPEPIPDAATLPDDVRDGTIADDASSPEHMEGE